MCLGQHARILTVNLLAISLRFLSGRVIPHSTRAAARCTYADGRFAWRMNGLSAWHMHGSIVQVNRMYTYIQPKAGGIYWGAAGWRRGAGGGFKYNPKGVCRRGWFGSDNNRRQASECAHTHMQPQHMQQQQQQQQMALGASENRAGRGAPGGGMFTYHPLELYGFSVKLISTDLCYSLNSNITDFLSFKCA